MRPRSYARKPTDAHMSSRTYIRAHTYIRPCTHVRTYTRTRRNFSNNKSALQHCQTEFHHQSDTIHFCYPITVQSISILAPPLIVPSVQTTIICHSFIVIFQLSFHHSIICQPSPIHYHHFPSSPSSCTHHILSLSNNQPNSPSYQYVSIL